MTRDLIFQNYIWLLFLLPFPEYPTEIYFCKSLAEFNRICQKPSGLIPKMRNPQKHIEHSAITKQRPGDALDDRLKSALLRKQLIPSENSLHPTTYPQFQKAYQKQLFCFLILPFYINCKLFFTDYYSLYFMFYSIQSLLL